jgi:predicted lipoprotein with Yx(FWY)xxD motif
MHRLPIFLISVLASVAGVSGLAGAHGAESSARAAGSATLELGHTRLGNILTTSSGRTLYEFARDPRNRDTCVRIGGCPSLWSALETSGGSSAGPGVHASLLSTIEIPGGARQVTYAGHPLYLYSGDSGPRQTSYVGVNEFGGAWDALDASGQAVR